MSENTLRSLIGETIYFINPQGRENSTVVTEKGVTELLKLQQYGYKFRTK